MLIVLEGSDVGKRFPLTEPTLTVGRHSTNAIALHDDRVSRQHLELRASPKGYQLFDLHSGNGTAVNDRPVQVIDLRTGDRIRVGDTLLQYVAGSTVTYTNQQSAARVVVRPGGDVPSAILKTVAEDAGSQILSRPENAANDWLKTRLASLTVLYEATTAVSQILDVDELLGRVMDLILPVIDADRGCALLKDSESGDLFPRAVRTRTGTGDVVVSRTVMDLVLKQRQGMLIEDAATDDRVRGGESIARHRIREVICVPMKGRHETVGVLFLDRVATDVGLRRPPFTEDHLTLAVAVAHQAALAVEETHYYQALVQAERLAAIGQTIAALSHHIKNIMQGVRFGSDMVRMALDGSDPELLQKGWRLVEKNQTKIDDLILDMLSYSKDREPLRDLTDLNGLTSEVLDVVRGRATEAGVALEFQPAVGLGAVLCDPDGINRALLNVVSNAVDAVDGRANAKVSVVIAADDSAVELRVTDNGPGFAPEKLGDIFKPFVSTKGARGTGLGLPVSRKILREHGGDVIAESTAGEGCKFTLRIPIRK